MREPERTHAALAREFRLLEYLLRRADRVLTRDMLLDDVWHYRFLPQTDLLDVHIGKCAARSIHQASYRSSIVCAAPVACSTSTAEIPSLKSILIGAGMTGRYLLALKTKDACPMPAAR